MTVAELIAKLQEMPQEAEIHLEDDEDSSCLHDVDVVRLARAYRDEHGDTWAYCDYMEWPQYKKMHAARLASSTRLEVVLIG